MQVTTQSAAWPLKDRHRCLQEKARKQAAAQVQHAVAFELEHKRVNEWDLSSAMAVFAGRLRQELK